MRHWLPVAAVVLLVMATGAEPLAGQGRGRERVEQPRAEATTASVVTDVEIRIIREYYAAQKVKPKPLPPGIAKNLARGKALPPGIARTRLPAELVGRLEPRPEHTWLIEANVVILVDPVGLVVEVLREIF